VKILALADEPSRALWDFNTRERLEGVDLILSCGDLPAEYLEYLTNFTTAPILYVHGNHDGKYAEHEPGGCVCIEDRIYVWNGLRIAGLGGCMRYSDREQFQYTERQMAHRAARLRLRARRAGGIDMLVTHAPARGLNDQPDPAHIGFDCFNRLLDDCAPGWFIHGHVHLRYDCRLPRTCTHGPTTVINASERYLFEIPDPQPEK
jgi:Icc-related predicted phosphoesterase